MRKIVSLFAIVALTTTAAVAAPSHIQRNANGGYNVTYDYQDKAKTGWYVGGRAELSFMNWKNKYSTDAGFFGASDYGEDSYSAEPVFGGSLFAGYTFNYFWRAELEAGYMGFFEDKDATTEFSLSIPYLMANGYYDFTNGLYVGAGVGIAVPRTTIDGVYFDGGKRDETAVSAMGALMAGYSYDLDDNLVLDLRYRFAIMSGVEHTLNFVDSSNAAHWFRNDIDLILDNSFSIGLRYEF